MARLITLSLLGSFRAVQTSSSTSQGFETKERTGRRFEVLLGLFQVVEPVKVQGDTNLATSDAVGCFRGSEDIVLRKRCILDVVEDRSLCSSE